MKPQHYNEKNIPKYLLISMALVQSEIYWIYSALYCVIRESGLLAEDRSTTNKSVRYRAHSAPLRSSNIYFTNDDFVKLDQCETERRSSLPTPTVNYRQRPNVHDERKGITCPPLWWQKTRVKLGRAPVRGDPKPKSIGGSISPSSSTATINNSVSPDTNAVRKGNRVYLGGNGNGNGNNGIDSPLYSRTPTYPVSTPSPALSVTLSSHSSSSFETIEEVEEQPEDIDLSRQISNISVVSISSKLKQQHKMRFMSKLNSALHNLHHRRVGSNESIKSSKK